MKFWDENLDPGWNEFRPGQNFGPEDENLVLDEILVRVNELNLIDQTLINRIRCIISKIFSGVTFLCPFLANACLKAPGEKIKLKNFSLKS